MTGSEILQTAKPIPFNTDMVRAILEGRKTTTRRAMKPQPIHDGGFWELGGAGWSDNIHRIYPVYGHSLYNRMPYKPGDILYIQETWGTYNRNWWEADYFMYRADYPEKASTYMHSDGIICDLPKWRPSTHMPKEAARIFLRVTDVRVERLKEISASQAMDEGFTDWNDLVRGWNNTIPKKDLDKYGWDANPWVWVIRFERIIPEDRSDD